jgi:hypothetical protein
MSDFCSTGYKKAQIEGLEIFCVFCAFLWLLCVRSEVSGARTNHDVLARGRHLNLAVTLVALLVDWIVTEHVLRAEFGCDLCKSVRQ